MGSPVNGNQFNPQHGPGSQTGGGWEPGANNQQPQPGGPINFPGSGGAYPMPTTGPGQQIPGYGAQPGGGMRTHDLQPGDGYGLGGGPAGWGNPGGGVRTHDLQPGDPGYGAQPGGGTNQGTPVPGQGQPGAPTMIGQPQQPYTGPGPNGFAHADRGSNFGKASSYAARGMMGKAKQQIEQGGGTWGKGMHKFLKRPGKQVIY